MRKQYTSTIIVTMLVVLLIGCEPAAPTVTPAPPTHTPMPPAATATPTLPSAPPTATAVATEPEPTVTPTPIATQPEGAPSPIQTERATQPTATQTELEPAPAPVEVEEISFQSGHFKLVGDLQIPGTEGKHPVIIMVHGDGGINRTDSGKYRPIMERFLRAGYAVFSWDKPGTGESTGEFVDGAYILSDRAAILVDAVELLTEHPAIDPERIGVWGISQAGYVMPLALTMTGDIAFMIVVSGPGVDSIDQTAYLIGQQLLCQGYSEEQAKLAEESFAGLCKATTYQEYRENKENLIQFPYALNFTGKDITPEEDWSPWDRDVDAFFNPIEVIEGTTIPVLAFFGEKDTQVDPLQGAQAYEQALQKAGNQNYQVELIPDVDHNIVLCETGCMVERDRRSRAGWLKYAPEYLDLMEEWLVQLSRPDLAAVADIRTYGGRQNDAAYDILLLTDGGTLIVGRANNTGPSHRITPGNARLIRTDADGNIIWQKDYAGETDAMFYSPIQVGEDAYVVLGQIAASYERDETDFYLVKIDGKGREIWSHTYGGRGMDHAKMVRQTSDGGFILIGGRADEFPSGGLYQGDIVLIKTDAEGNEVWTRTYGDKILYLGWGVAQTPDGGYVLIGWEAKTIPDRDVIAIKTDEAGEVEWSRTWDLDPGDRDGGFDLILTADGHIVIACIRSMDSGVRGAVLIKVDLEGNEIWKKVLGEKGVDNEFWDIMEDADGGYVAAGATLPGKNPATGEDIRRGLIIKTDQDGEILWQYVFEGDEYELTHFSSAVVLPDGGYIFVGQAIRKGETSLDMLWLKLRPDGMTLPPTDTAVLPTGTNAPALEAISVDTADQVERLYTLNGHSDRVNDLAFSGDGAYLASSSLDKTIKLWDVENWQQVHAFSMNKAGLNGIAFSPNGRLLASADAIWDVESRQVVHVLERGRNDPGPVAFSPDGSLLAVALEGRPIKLWNVASGEVLRTFKEQPDDVTFSIAFSPDGALLAAGVHGGMVRLWDVTRGQIVGTLEYGNESDVHDLAFSPDGGVLASAGNDETVRLWDVREPQSNDVASGQAVHILRHGNGLYGVALSPDGRLVAAACCDRTVKLWDVASGRRVRSLPHDDEVMSVAFSPDGRLLASGGYDNQIYLWGIPH